MAAKPANVRIYVDEDLLGLAHVLASLRSDVTYPGDPGAIIHKRERPPCPIARSTADEKWLPDVTRRGWLIISRDLNIRENIAELRAVRESGARMVALASDDARGKWDQVELFMRRWRGIESQLAKPGPFIFRASFAGLRELDLSDEGWQRRARRRRSSPSRTTRPAPTPHEALFEAQGPR